MAKTKPIDFSGTTRLITRLTDQDLKSLAGMGYLSGQEAAHVKSFVVDEELALARAKTPAEIRARLLAAVEALQHEKFELPEERQREHALLEKFGVIKHLPKHSPKHGMALDR